MGDGFAVPALPERYVALAHGAKHMRRERRHAPRSNVREDPPKVNVKPILKEGATMYGFDLFEKHDQSLPRNADGFFQLSDDSPIDIQRFIEHAHIIRRECMAETIRSLGRSARGQVRKFG